MAHKLHQRRRHVKYFYIHLSVMRRTGHRVDMASRTSPTSPSSAQIFGNRRGISFLFFIPFQTKYNTRTDHSSSDKWESTPVPSRFKLFSQQRQPVGWWTATAARPNSFANILLPTATAVRRQQLSLSVSLKNREFRKRNNKSQNQGRPCPIVNRQSTGESTW